MVSFSIRPIRLSFGDALLAMFFFFRGAGGLFFDASPEIEKELKNELDRAARIYNVTGDPKKFPDLKIDGAYRN